MTIQISWDSETQTALLIHFDYEWTWEDFHTMVLDVAAQAGQVEHKVDLIFDLSDSHPVGSEAVIHLRRWINLWPTNSGRVAVISRQLMITAVVAIIGRTNPGCRGVASLAPTLEEARRILAERRGD